MSRSLLFDSLYPASVAPPVVRGNNTGSANAATISITLPVTTNAGDCIVVSLYAGYSGTGVVTGSGAGASWSTVQEPYEVGTVMAVVVGANCSAGQTTCSIAVNGAYQILVVTSVWSDVAASSPVFTSAFNTTSSASSVTAGPASFWGGNLLISVAVDDSGGAITGSWSNGVTNNRVNTTAAGIRVAQDYIGPSAAGSTSYQASGGTANWGALWVALTPASNPARFGQPPMNPPVGTLGQYSSSQIILDDSFTGTTLSSNWCTIMGGPAPIGRFTNMNDPTAVTVNNGLTLKNTNGTQTGSGIGCVNTFNPDTQTNLFTWPNTGFFVQVNAKMSDMAHGFFPAIWFPTATSVMNSLPEIDIFEGGMIDANAPSTPFNQVWEGNFGGGSTQWAGFRQQWADAGVDLTAGFHVYGMEWRPGVSCTLYLDGVQVFQQVQSDTGGIPQTGGTIYNFVMTPQSPFPSSSGYHSQPPPGTGTMEIAEVQVYSTTPTPAPVPAVGWWTNASDTAPIPPAVVLDFCSGAACNTYSSSSAARIATIGRAGADLFLGVGNISAAQANAIVAACVAGGQSTGVVFRVMWEMNTNFINANWDQRSGWSAATYISNFTTVAGYLKSAMPSCKIVWNPQLTNSAPMGRTPYDTFPGAACDYVAWDGYDAAGSVANYVALGNTFIGLANNTWNKPWGIGEWGLSSTFGPNGGDDPAYIDAVANLCTDANGCIFQSYFSSSGGGGFVSELSNYPDCKARYIADFPADGGTWPPGSSPPTPPTPPRPTISSVGSLATVNTTNGGTTLSVTPANVGDLMVLAIETGAAVHLTSVTGGGVTTWVKALQWLPSGDREIWFGTVTSTGASTITFAWSGSTGTHNVEYNAQEFTTGGTPTWQTVTSNEIINASSTNMPFPSLTPSSPNELYVGLAVAGTTATGGSTSGYTFTVTAWGNVFAYNAACSSSAQAPIATQTPAAASNTFAVMFAAS